MAKRNSDLAPIGFLEKAATNLDQQWQFVVNDHSENTDLKYIEASGLAEKISNAINHAQVAYRFLLPIQLLGKVTDANLDCRAMQAGADRPGAWNARTLGSNVVAPWNSKQGHVLGSSADPYVGNPARRQMMTEDTAGLKDKPGWLMLLSVLNEIEERRDTDFTLAVFRQALLEILHRQSELQFTFPIPARLSLERTLKLCSDYLSERSGGERALILAAALFTVVGEAFGLFASVSRGQINAADQQTGMAGDLECLNSDGQIVLMVEVKERKLTIQDFEGTLLKARGQEIKEIFILAQGTESSSESAILQRTANAYSTGESVYVFDFLDLSRGVLALGAEAIRRSFVIEVGNHLDALSTQPKNRLRWKELLEEI